MQKDTSNELNNSEDRLSSFFKGQSHPNLFLIGAPKSGTTSIYRYLQKSPDVYVPSIKEPSYFNFPENEDLLNAYIDNYKPSSERMRLDASSISIYCSATLPQKLKLLNDEIKIILILRNPSERFISFFNFLKHMNLLDSRKNLSEFIEECEYAYKNEPDLEYSDYHIDGARYLQSPHYGGYYYEHLKRWHEVFGVNMKVYFFDSLASESSLLMSDVSRFLSIEDVWENKKMLKENQTLHPKNKYFHVLAINLYKKFGDKLNRNQVLKRWLLGVYIRVNHNSSSPKVNGNDLKKLKRLYQDDTLKTLEYLKVHGIHYGAIPSWVEQDC